MFNPSTFRTQNLKPIICPKDHTAAGYLRDVYLHKVPNREFYYARAKDDKFVIVVNLIHQTLQFHNITFQEFKSHIDNGTYFHSDFEIVDFDKWWDNGMGKLFLEEIEDRIQYVK